MLINPSLSQDDMGSLINVICLNIDQDHLDKAMTNTEYGLSRFPENPHFQNFKGLILSYQGSIEESLIWLLKSEEAFSKEAESDLAMIGKVDNWINIATAYEYLDDIANAFATLNKVIGNYGEKENDLIANAYFERSNLHFLNGSTVLAINDLQRAKVILEINCDQIDREETILLSSIIEEKIAQYSKA
jgi:tetratricopeptide (TPR) repeat protein